MSDNEDLNVEYDTTGVQPSNDSRTPIFTASISKYFYNKIKGISNDEEFTNEELNEYGLSLDEDDDELINISTTGKLIKYLKAIIKKNISSISSEIDKKLDSTDYKIDSTLKNNSTNPVQNKVIYNSISSLNTSKSNVGHKHGLNDINSLSDTINSLNTNINSKSNITDLNNHINNRNNPHGVTKAQIGLGNVPNLQINVGKVTFTNGVKKNNTNFRTVRVGNGTGYLFLTIKKNADLVRLGRITAYHDGVDADGDVDIYVANHSDYDMPNFDVQYLWVKI